MPIQHNIFASQPQQQVIPPTKPEQHIPPTKPKGSFASHGVSPTHSVQRIVQNIEKSENKDTNPVVCYDRQVDNLARSNSTRASLRRNLNRKLSLNLKENPIRGNPGDDPSYCQFRALVRTPILDPISDPGSLAIIQANKPIDDASIKKDLQAYFEVKYDLNGYSYTPNIAILAVLGKENYGNQVIDYLFDNEFFIDTINSENILECTKIIDLLLNQINDTTLTAEQSQKLFKILQPIYKALPTFKQNNLSLYGKLHCLFGMLVTYNAKDIISTLKTAMEGDNKNEYFNLYINANTEIENDYLGLIIKIYDNKKATIDYELFETLLHVIRSNDLAEKSMSSAKALYFADAIFNIISNFDEEHKSIFIRCFIKKTSQKEKKNCVFDKFLYYKLTEDDEMKQIFSLSKNQHKYIDEIGVTVKKTLKHPKIDYSQEQYKATCVEINKNYLVDISLLSSEDHNAKKENIIDKIDKLKPYNCNNILNYLLSKDDIVLNQVLKNTDEKAYDAIIELLVKKIKSADSLNANASNKAFNVLEELYRKLPSMDKNSGFLYGKLHNAFSLLLVHNKESVISVLQESISVNPKVYFNLYIDKTGQIRNNYLELIAEIFAAKTDNAKLLDDFLLIIKKDIKEQPKKYNYKLLVIAKSLSNIIENLTVEQQKNVIKSLLDDKQVSIELKYFLHTKICDKKTAPYSSDFCLDEAARNNTRRLMTAIENKHSNT